MDHDMIPAKLLSSPSPPPPPPPPPSLPTGSFDLNRRPTIKDEDDDDDDDSSSSDSDSYSCPGRESGLAAGFSPATAAMWLGRPLLFDESYNNKADVVVHTQNGGYIYAHATILAMSSPVLECLLKTQPRDRNQRRNFSVCGVPQDAVRVFIRYLYASSSPTSCYDHQLQQKLKEFAIHLLVLSHVFMVPRLKRECELILEGGGMLTIDNVSDVAQLASLCNAPRLCLISHRFISSNFKAVSRTQGWSVMKKAHPQLEKQIRKFAVESRKRKKAMTKKKNERKVYEQLYEAMEALVHICRDGCRTIGPHDMELPPKEEKTMPCEFPACRRLELLLRHFAGCKLRVPGGCAHCKRMWRLLELHSCLCVDSNSCRVPLCRTFKERSQKQSKKEKMKWRVLAKKILRSKSISGAPYFSLM